MSGSLYVLGTPLGNLGDLSPRAAEVLGAVDLVAAEDTRRTRILLDHAGVRPRIVSFHAHSKPHRLEELLNTLSEGGSVALVTDAGTPSISDPGAALVRAAHERGVPVVAVPGPSAVAAALSVSGFGADRFTFLGFAPRRGRARRDWVEAAANSPHTVVVFESPERLVRLLEDLAARCGEDRPAVVTRELTKVHEEIRSGTLSSLGGYYRERTVRGEITVVVGGAPPDEAAEMDEDAVVERARALMAQGVSRRDAAARVAEELRMSRREIYRLVSTL